MIFNELLNHYISTIGCTASELADASNISSANISRYRSGDRVPGINSGQLQSLSSGLSVLAQKKGIDEITESKVFSELSDTLNKSTNNYDVISDNLNRLIYALNINITEMARTLNYDPSYISRIRSKQRHPSDINTFLDKVCRFVIHKYSGENHLNQLSFLLNCTSDDINTSHKLLERLESWFSVTPDDKSDDSMSDFLNKLEEFNLDEYIRMIHFDTMKLPSVPFQLSSQRKHYYGIEEFKQAELDFLKATVLSKSNASVYMCSDMPMEEMSKDMDFGKKWMFGIAAMLKKNLHLNVIHNLNRPFNELMLGLESWIPLYMTGQISPYYLKNPQTDIYNHFHYCSGEASLSGEAISGHHNDGIYYLTRRKEEVSHYRTLVSDLLNRAQPLMNIYRSNMKEEYCLFLQKEEHIKGEHININASLPLYTINSDLLEEILNNNHVPQDKKTIIHAYAEEEKKRIERILENGSLNDELPEITDDEFNKHPLVLPLSGLFIEDDIFYTYEEYNKHLDMTFSFAENHNNYAVSYSERTAFRNIQITIHKGKWVMISKNKYPAIHFAIFHPKLREAIENMVVVYAEPH